MGVAPDPHHVSGTWTIPLTMQLAQRSSESRSKIPTAVPFVQNNLTEHTPTRPWGSLKALAACRDRGAIKRRLGDARSLPGLRTPRVSAKGTLAGKLFVTLVSLALTLAAPPHAREEARRRPRPGEPA